MTRLASLLGFGPLLIAAFVISCSETENKSPSPGPSVAPTVSQTASPVASPAPTPSISNRSAPPTSQVKSLPPEGGDIPTRAEFDGYVYTYKKDGEKTVATFEGKLLAADRDVVAGAVRDVIARSYRDKVDPTLRLAGSAVDTTMRIAGRKHQYVVVPVKEASGEILSLIITQLTE